MKIVNFTVSGLRRLGFLLDDEMIDPLATSIGERSDNRALFADTASFIRSGAAGREVAKAIVNSGEGRHSLGDVRLTSPILPSTILCSGSNYRAHNAEKVGAPISGKEPEFFVMTSDCVVGPDEPIVFDPELTQKLDCETELAIVIGREGRHIPVESALDYVFGYTVANDVTARDRQVRRSPEGFTWYEVGRGKAFDSSSPLGPCIVTADEIGDPQTLTLRTRINGELRQSSPTADMIWTCADLIHFFSINFTLRPGMVILTGTPAGTAWSTDAELGGKWQGQEGLVAATRYCLPGDVIENEIDRIGILRNAVVHV
ncbi:UNVERIFIED_ORG: 2-keto-4-pentenoate hydratase/2-oxohepta-3-ene-1,7-dioic acid hydratase in catechol pathway [Paraburkholderia sediminicola]|nr:2-keto-4-pentenoate hydratase/2-oxohepta-3-ene-1,7-dioic acid hydratase in catechol pathway [Paraburkholderia sediminicola]